MTEESFIPTGNAAVDAAFRRLIGRHDARFKDIEDAMLVQAHLEAKAASRMKEHAEQIVAHADWLARHEEIMNRFDVSMQEMTEKMNFLLNREMKREGGPEAI